MRLHPFEEAVRGTLRHRELLDERARVLVALSGGADSTALLLALSALRDAGWLTEVRACHVDHGLRPGSAADGEACGRLCAAHAIPLTVIAVHVGRGENVQAAARRARYRALRSEAARSGASAIATGHTLGDQAETVLHRLLRGAGARGLAGIPPRRGALVRPLIDRTREEVLAYLRARHVAWREDPTNASPRYLRNRIRAELLPMLEALAPGAARRLASVADLLRADDRALEARARRLVPRGADRVAIEALLRAPAAVRRRAVRRLWQSARAGGELSAAHVEAVLAHLGSRAPKRVSLPGDVEMGVRRGELRAVKLRRSVAGG